MDKKREDIIRAICNRKLSLLDEKIMKGDLSWSDAMRTLGSTFNEIFDEVKSTAKEESYVPTNDATSIPHKDTPRINKDIADLLTSLENYMDDVYKRADSIVNSLTAVGDADYVTIDIAGYKFTSRDPELVAKAQASVQEPLLQELYDIKRSIIKGN